jgi:hypothetical protein
MNKYGLQKQGYWDPIIVLCVVRLHDGASPGFVLRFCRQVTSAYGISIPVAYYIAPATSPFSTHVECWQAVPPPPPSRASSVIRSFLNFTYFRHAATVIVPLPSVHQSSSHPSTNTPRSSGSVEPRFVILCVALQIVVNSGHWGPIFVLLTRVILKYDVSPTWSIAGYH